jgi:hypothetical protein
MKRNRTLLFIFVVSVFLWASHNFRGADAFTKAPITKDRVTGIQSISSTVGKGEVLFEQGKKPGMLKMTFKGVSIKTIKGKACFACAKTVKIAPNVKIDTSFFLDTGTIDRENVGKEFDVEDMTLDGTLSENAREFIMSGPQGATLRKVGKGFKLLEGEAYLLQK